jgi:hypothetical protein
LAAQLRAEFFGKFFLVVFDDDLDEEVGSHGLPFYTKYVPCAICKTAKTKRFCPGLNEQICTACCGAGREETIDCPLTCEYLAEAHLHEKKPPSDPEATPGKDVPIDDDFLRANEFLIVLVGSAMFDAVRPHTSATDTDAVDALDSLARTWRTLVAGIYYETKPVNPVAMDIFDGVKAGVENIRNRMKEAGTTQSLPDAVVLGVLVFLQRVAFGLNNGRSKCKAFLVFLSQFYVDTRDDEEEASGLAVDDAPRVVL